MFDVLAAGINPLIHFHTAGMKEGRKAKIDASVLDSGLRRLTLPETGRPDTILKFDGEVNFPARKPKIFVHVHLYHEDMCDQVLKYLKNLDIPFNLGVSIKSQSLIEKYSIIFKNELPNVASVLVKSVLQVKRGGGEVIIDAKSVLVKSVLKVKIDTWV